MSDLVALTPHLDALHARLDGDMIIWRPGEPACELRFPLPPWSTPQDIDQTSGIFKPPDVHDGFWITWDDDNPARSADFEIFPQHEDPNKFERKYAVWVTSFFQTDLRKIAHTPDPFRATSKSRRQVITQTRVRTLTIDLHPGDGTSSPNPRFLITAAARDSDIYAALTLEYMTPPFDADDPATWPVSQATLRDWADLMGRIDVTAH